MKPLSTDELVKHLKNRSPEQWATLNGAMKLAPDNLTKMKVEAFLADPRGNPLTPGQHEFMHEWILGHFAISNSTGEMIRVSVQPGASMILGIKGNSVEEMRDRHGITKPMAYQPGSAAGPVVHHPATRQGKDLPDAAECKKEARLRAERKAEEERLANRKSPVQALMTFGAKRA